MVILILMLLKMKLTLISPCDRMILPVKKGFFCAIDKKFKRNAEGCMKYNIPFGFYYYSYALNEEEGKEEVQFFIKNIEKYIPFVSFPCFIDMEDSDNYKQNHGNPSNEVLAKICENAIKELNNKQVFAGIYASYDYFKRKLNFEKLKDCIKWVAWWNDKAESTIDKNNFAMLQYSSKGKVAGVQGFVDSNLSFRNFKKVKEYVDSVSKIQSIKLLTGLEDLTMQFLSCYKWGKDLINKIFLRITGQKIKYERLSLEKLKATIQKEYKLESKTIVFLSNYIYGDILFEKLYSAITFKH